MITRHISTAAPGVRKEEFEWGYLYEGPKEALICAGLVQESWLSDGTVLDKRGRVVRQKQLTVNGRETRTTMTSAKRQMFTVYVKFTDAEIAARKSAEAAAEVRREIETMPKSAEAYRKHMINFIEIVGRGIILATSDPSDSGYRFHAETISELQRLAGDMVKAIEIGEVVFDRKARTAAEIKIKAKAAKADPAVQSFMQQITGQL